MLKSILGSISVDQCYNIVRRQTVCIEYSFEYFSFNWQFSTLDGKSTTYDYISGSL